MSISIPEKINKDISSFMKDNYLPDKLLNTGIFYFVTDDKFINFAFIEKVYDKKTKTISHRTYTVAFVMYLKSNTCRIDLHISHSNYYKNIFSKIDRFKIGRMNINKNEFFYDIQKICTKELLKTNCLSERQFKNFMFSINQSYIQTLSVIQQILS